VVFKKFFRKFIGLILLSSIGGAALFLPQTGLAESFQIFLSKEATGMASRRTILFEGTLDRIF